MYSAPPPLHRLPCVSLCVWKRERGGEWVCVSVCVFVCILGKRHSLQRKPLRCERAPHFLNRRNHRERKNTRGRKRATFVENNRLVCRTRWVCHYNPFQASVEWVFSSRVRVLRLNFTESYRKQYRFVCFFHPLENLTVRVRRVTLNPG